MIRMTTIAWVSLGAILILFGTLIMFYFPYKEQMIKEMEIREKGKFTKRISFKTPILGNGTSSFKIVKIEPSPFLTDGKGDGVLYIPNPNGTGEGIIYTWIQDNEMKISLTIYDKQGTVVTYISGSEWTVNKSVEIDCNYDLENFEVVRVNDSKVIPVLQIQLKQDKINLAFETYLKGGIAFFWGNNRIEFKNEKNKFITNDLKPLFYYPSNKNFGRRK